VKCPYCEHAESKVVDSRPTDDNHAIRRRRECTNCNNRFTTYEKVEDVPIIIVKRDGTRETFNRSKISNGLIRACEKRPVTAEDIDRIADDVERAIHNKMDKEITSTYIGELIMHMLKDHDEVAYVRFASVYRSFKDVNTFVEELTKLLNGKEL